MYLDANNLYGWEMSKYFPYGGFKRLTLEEIKKKKNDVNSISENNSDGYMLRDLEYPDELYVSQNDYPLAPEKLEICNDMLSKYYSEIAKKYGIKVGGVTKLLPNLDNKSKCVVHYRNLQLHLSLRIG